jgi:hypothetical protein
MIPQCPAASHNRLSHGRAATWAMVALAVMASGCSGPAAGSASYAASSEAATAPPDPAGSQVAGSAPAWIDTLQMISATTGWALLWPANPDHHSALAVARTTDGGQIWTAVTPPPAVAGLAAGQVLLQAATARRAWIVVTAGNGQAPAKTHVFSTTDSGQWWRESAAVGGAAQPVAIDFAGSRRGWLLDSLGAAMNENPVKLYRSTDGGAHWSLAGRSPRMAGDPASSSGLPVTCDKDGVAFASARTGWITSSCPGGPDDVLVSTDGGAHWAPAVLPPAAQDCQPSGCDIASPQFVRHAVFLVIGVYPAGAYLLVSNNGGQDWQTRPMPGGAGPYPRVRFFSADDGIAVSAGSQGTIGRDFYLTTDGGLNWTAVRQGRRFGSWDDFDFVSQQAGFSWTYPGGGTEAVPHLVRTSDSGRIWTSVVPRLRGPV